METLLPLHFILSLSISDLCIISVSFLCGCEGHKTSSQCQKDSLIHFLCDFYQQADCLTDWLDVLVVVLLQNFNLGSRKQ